MSIHSFADLSPKELDEMEKYANEQLALRKNDPRTETQVMADRCVAAARDLGMSDQVDARHIVLKIPKKTSMRFTINQIMMEPFRWGSNEHPKDGCISMSIEFSSSKGKDDWRKCVFNLGNGSPSEVAEAMRRAADWIEKL